MILQSHREKAAIAAVDINKDFVGGSTLLAVYTNNSCCYAIQNVANSFKSLPLLAKPSTAVTDCQLNANHVVTFQILASDLRSKHQITISDLSGRDQFLLRRFLIKDISIVIATEKIQQ